MRPGRTRRGSSFKKLCGCPRIRSECSLDFPVQQRLLEQEDICCMSMTDHRILKEYDLSANALNDHPRDLNIASNWT